MEFCRNVENGDLSITGMFVEKYIQVYKHFKEAVENGDLSITGMFVEKYIQVYKHFKEAGYFRSVYQ